MARWLSPRASVSRWDSWPLGSYTADDEQWKNAFTPATFSTRKATPSALAARALSNSLSFATAMWMT